MKDESGKMKETMLLTTLTTYAAMRKEKGERRKKKEERRKKKEEIGNVKSTLGSLPRVSDKQKAVISFYSLYI